jgi:hypothetical protein
VQGQKSNLLMQELMQELMWLFLVLPMSLSEQGQH